MKLSNQFTKKLTYVGIACLALSVPLLARTTLQKIEALLNPNLTYVVDGVQMTDTVDALTYKDHTYLPVAELSRILGKEIQYDKGVITITSPSADTPSTATELPDFVQIDRTYIQEISPDNSRILVAETDENGQWINPIILLTSENTVVNSAVVPNAEKTLQNLLVGMPVAVKHDAIMLHSYPPQTGAQEITMLEEPSTCIGVPPVQNITIPATVISQDIENSRVLVSYMAEFEGVQTEMELVLLIDPEATFIHHELNKRIYRIDDLTPGTKLLVTHSPIMTASLPPQSPAIEIVVLANQN